MFLKEDFELFRGREQRISNIPLEFGKDKMKKTDSLYE